MPLYWRFYLKSLLVFLLLVTTIPAQAKWPTKNFEIFVGKPATSNFKLGVSAENVYRGVDEYVDLDMPEKPAKLITADTIKDIEVYLEEIAIELESMGFPAPTLEPIVKRSDGSLAYRLYLYDFPNPTDTASFRSDLFCKDEVRPIITINAAFYFSNGLAPTDKGDNDLPHKLIDKGYQDIPHELFHAVQQSYPLFSKNCLLGDWIVEGTAQAIGADLAANSSYKKDYPNRIGMWMRDRWGRRAYDKPLWVPSNRDTKNSTAYIKNNAYGASSFWRYLGEIAASSGTAGTKRVTPDYRYLTDFFLGDGPAGTNETAEMTWLNDRLLTHPKFKTSVHRIYPYFINTFASYVPYRISPPAGMGPSDAAEKWLEILFPRLKCPEIRISEATPIYRGEINILAYATACFRLNLGFYQPVDLHIEISDLDINAIRSISVGTEQGAIVAQPMLKKQLDGNWTGSRTLHIRHPMSTPQPQLIISNINSRPVLTRPFKANIEIAASTFNHSMLPAAAKATTAKATQSGSRSSSGNTGKQITTTAQADRVGSEIDEGMESLNPNLANGTQINWQTQQHPCDDAFVTKVCGPHTLISLSAVPGMFASIEQTTGRGGEFGQFFTMLSGLAKTGPLAASKKYQQALESASELDGVEVNIAIPLIDYGFQGTFNNASLHVSKSGGGHYQSIGPQDIQPGPGAEYALSGKVTIDEFTPSILRGSFQGAMVDPDSIATMDEDAALPVAANISGQFQVVGTWQEDGRIYRRPAEDIAKSVNSDVAALSSQPSDQSSRPDLRTSERKDSVTTGNSASGSGVIQCDCSCNRMEDSLAECDTYCVGTFRACRGQMATALTLQKSAFKPTELQAEAGEPFLRTIPDACEVMNATSLAQALSVPEVTQKGPHEWIPQALSQCGYVVPGQKGYKAQLQMMFQSLDHFNSRQQSAEQVTIAATGFATVDASEVHKTPGNISIVTHADSTSNLIVLTGIYGFGWQSEDFGTELVLTYSLSHPTASAELRSKLLRELAQPQVAALQKLAVTTHEAL